MNYPHPLLAREGWLFIAGAVLLAVLTWWFAGFLWSLPLWLVTLFVVQFFRDPPREVPALVSAVLSPADGRIVTVQRAHDMLTQRESLLISVFMNVFNVHSNRSPVDGTVESVTYSRGTFVNADVYLPVTARPRVAVGDIVYATTTVLAEI